MNRRYSLKKNEDIKGVLNHQHKRFCHGIGVFVKPNPSVADFRIAFSVPKKYGNAAKRNHLKRRLREVVRTFNIKSKQDIFVMVRPDYKPQTFEDLTRTLHTCFTQLKLIGENDDQS